MVAPMREPPSTSQQAQEYIWRDCENGDVEELIKLVWWAEQYDSYVDQTRPILVTAFGTHTPFSLCMEASEALWIKLLAYPDPPPFISHSSGRPGMRSEPEMETIRANPERFAPKSLEELLGYNRLYNIVPTNDLIKAAACSDRHVNLLGTWLYTASEMDIPIIISQALKTASERGAVMNLELLLNEMPYPYVPYCLYTALISAILGDHVAAVYLLLAVAPQDDGSIAVHCALESRNVECAQAFIWHGYDLMGSTNVQRPNLLHEAKSAEAVMILLSHGGDPNVQHLGDGPLHTAVMDENAQVVGALLEGGANTFIRNNNGYTPLDLAIEYKVPYIAEMIREASPVWGYLKILDRANFFFYSSHISLSAVRTWWIPTYENVWLTLKGLGILILSTVAPHIYVPLAIAFLAWHISEKSELNYLVTFIVTSPGLCAVIVFVSFLLLTHLPIVLLPLTLAFLAWHPDVCKGPYLGTLIVSIDVSFSILGGVYVMILHPPILAAFSLTLLIFNVVYFAWSALIFAHDISTCRFHKDSHKAWANIYDRLYNNTSVEVFEIYAQDHHKAHNNLWCTSIETNALKAESPRVQEPSKFSNKQQGCSPGDILCSFYKEANKAWANIYDTLYNITGFKVLERYAQDYHKIYENPWCTSLSSKTEISSTQEPSELTHECSSNIVGEVNCAP